MELVDDDTTITHKVDGRATVNMISAKSVTDRLKYDRPTALNIEWTSKDDHTLAPSV